MTNISEIIEEILVEWAYRVHDGMPNPKNAQHIHELRESMEEMNLPNNVIYEVIQNLINEDGGLSDKEKEKAKKMNLVHLGKGAYGKEGGEASHQAVDGKLVAKGDKEEPEKETKPPMKIDANPFDDKEKDTDGEEKTDTSVAISKVNDKRFGVLKKKETALEKGYIGSEDAKKLDEFNQDINEFLKNPTKEVAEALVEKYKLSQNASGSKLYLGFIAGDGRKILGENNKLVQGVSGVINKFVDLKSKGDVQKKAMDKLQSTSKPELTTVVKNDDPGVQKLFSTPPYDRLDEKYHQVFGPKGEDGQLLRPSSEHSKEYFQQSVNENKSLDKTIEALKELEEQGNASPGVRNALEQHKDRMNKISKNFDSMSIEERRKAVEESYSQMAREMHKADADVARGLMKNMAEMALYDSEIAGGDECYLPSSGVFPSGDKLRVDRDGNGVVEKIAAVSVKFGKSGAFYGFPGESAQYVKFHPDSDKQNSMRNRVGHKGHSLGVRDDLIQEPKKFDKMLKESGLDGAIKDTEKLKTKLSEMQEEIDKIRDEITNDVGKYSNKDLVTKRKQLEELNKESQSLLKEAVDIDKLTEIIGKENTRLFMSGGCQAVNIICMASALKTSDGLSVIEHNHQLIDKDGLTSETDKGTTNLKQWRFAFRAFDKRGGGLLSGFIGGEQ